MPARHRLAPTAVFIVAALLIGCSSSDPQIMQIDYRIVATATENGEAVTERLSLAVDVFDPDGEGEFDTLTVRAIDRNIEWRLSGRDLVRLRRGGQTWFGHDNLRVSGSARIPRTRYLVVAADLSGREAQREIQLPATLPEVSVEQIARVVDDRFVIPAGASRVFVLATPVRSEPRRRELRVGDQPLPDREVHIPVDSVPLSELRALTGTGTSGPDEVPIWVIGHWTDRLWTESGPWIVPRR